MAKFFAIIRGKDQPDYNPPGCDFDDITEAINVFEKRYGDRLSEVQMEMPAPKVTVWRKEYTETFNSQSIPQ